MDNENNVWMSVNGGLLKYNYSKPLKVFDSDTNGFFYKQCTSFYIDLKGDGWLTTNGGFLIFIVETSFMKSRS